jgi:hypothetical protein
MRFTSIRSLVSVALAASLAACSGTPTEPTSWSFDRVREELGFSNLNHVAFGQSGRLTRWRLPIAVTTNGIARAETALRHYEQWTGGIVQFTRVTGTPPPNGLVFVEGGAVAAQEGGSCGNVSSAPLQDSSPVLTFQWDASRALVGTYTIHLGSSQCDDALAGHYSSAVAEHQLAHALGVANHFDGFAGNGGLDDPRLLAVIYNLYTNALGATSTELVIWGPR